MRIRFSELLESKGLTVHALARKLDGRVSRSGLYRLKAADGRAPTFDSELLEALCDAFEVDAGELLERDAAEKKPAKKATKKRARQ